MLLQESAGWGGWGVRECVCVRVYTGLGRAAVFLSAWLGRCSPPPLPRKADCFFLSLFSKPHWFHRDSNL